MSIAEKLTTIAENMQGVYDKGFADGQSQGGGDEYQTAMWNGIQQNGTRTDYQNAFRYWKKSHDYWKPLYDIKTGGISMMFYGFSSDIGLPELCKRAGITIDTSGSTTFGQVFSYATIPDVGTIDFTNENCTSIGTPFIYSYVAKAHLIVKADGSQTGWTNVFTGAKYLTDLTIEGVIGDTASFRDCPLNKASIENVFEVLSGTKSGKTVTFKKSAVNDAFGIDVDDETTFPEGSEYYELRNSKSNWTVGYA